MCKKVCTKIFPSPVCDSPKFYFKKPISIVLGGLVG